MKVVIGNYPKCHIRCLFFTRYMDNKYGYDWPNGEKYTKFESFLEKLEDSVQSFYNSTINRILRKRQRKIYVRIDPHDTWNADNTLAHVILPVLKKLKANKHGTPYTDREDAPADSVYDDAAGDDYEKGFNTKRWEYILDQMIYSFECTINEDWDDQFYTDEKDSYKLDKEAFDKAWEARKNGLRLFAKYYHSLWD